MGEITSKEPKHWHDEHGRHTMTDPRRIHVPQPVGDGEGHLLIENGQVVMSVPLARKNWPADERAYAEHLDAHEDMAEIPEPRDDDSETVQTIFENIGILVREIATMRQLVVSLREKEAMDRKDG